MKLFFALAGIGFCGATLFGSASPIRAAEKPSLDRVRFEQRIGEQLPLDTRLTSDDGSRVTLAELLRGSTPRILVFAYYRCPNLCTLVLNGLTQAMRALQERLGTDYEVLTVSIDPNEKPNLALMKKRAYLARYGQIESDSWRFLTGDEASVRRLADAAGFHYERDPISGEYSHPSGIVVVSPKGRISQYLFGIQFDPRSLHEALDAARQGKSGSWVDAVLLYCFHYDPASSENGRVILLGIRIAGILGALSLVTLLLYLSRPRDEARA